MLMQTYIVSADDITNNPLLTVFGINAGDTLEYSITPAVVPTADVENSDSQNDTGQAQADVENSTT